MSDYTMHDKSNRVKPVPSKDWFDAQHASGEEALRLGMDLPNTTTFLIGTLVVLGGELEEAGLSVDVQLLRELIDTARGTELDFLKDGLGSSERSAVVMAEEKAEQEGRLLVTAPQVLGLTLRNSTRGAHRLLSAAGQDPATWSERLLSLQFEPQEDRLPYERYSEVTRAGQQQSGMWASRLGDPGETTTTMLLGMLEADRESGTPEVPAAGCDVDIDSLVSAVENLRRTSSNWCLDAPQSALRAAEVKAGELANKNGGDIGVARLIACMLMQPESGSAKAIRSIGQDPAEWAARLLTYSGDA